MRTFTRLIIPLVIASMLFGAYASSSAAQGQPPQPLPPYYMGGYEYTSGSIQSFVISSSRGKYDAMLWEKAFQTYPPPDWKLVRGPMRDAAGQLYILFQLVGTYPPMVPVVVMPVVAPPPAAQCQWWPCYN
jgi:hypothetical protein